MRKSIVTLLVTLLFIFDVSAECTPPEITWDTCDSTSVFYFDCVYLQDQEREEAETAYQNCVAASGETELQYVCSTVNITYYGDGWFEGERDDYSDYYYGTPCDSTFVPEQTSNTYFYNDYDGSSCSVVVPQTRTERVLSCQYVDAP